MGSQRPPDGMVVLWLWAFAEGPAREKGLSCVVLHVWAVAFVLWLTRPPAGIGEEGIQAWRVY